jgi:hypothetical protein
VDKVSPIHSLNSSAPVDTPFGEVVMIQHRDGRHVPDAKVAASTPRDV